MRVLTVNAGSSSLKLRVIGDGDSVVASRDDGDLGAILTDAGQVDAVGHRVVHGGERYRAATVLDDDVVATIESLVPLAPLHQPAALAGIAQVSAALPGVPAVACFDTAFHTTLPAAAATYALPQEWNERFGLRRYGFHGLSHSWASRRGADLTGRSLGDLRIVSCHLGAGASCCAVAHGQSVDTTMGFTPVEGLVMATRSGSVDPGLVTWLITRAGLDAGEVTETLERHAGLAGLSGVEGGDMRDVLARADAGDERSGLAVDVWTHRLRREIAAVTAAAGGIDLLVFTGGVGEHAPRLRARACEELGWLGVLLDGERNEAAHADAVVSRPDSAVTVAVVTSREDLQIAGEVRAALA